MIRELIVDVRPEGVQAALLEDNELVELHDEVGDQHFTVGDIFLANVAKHMPSLDAAFMNLGIRNHEGFLHYTDLGKNLKSFQKFINDFINENYKDLTLNNFHLQPEIPKGGSIKNVLKSNKYILVQVVKEPISNKGPKLSCELSFAGRFLVLMPFNDSVSISKKITDTDERERLKQIVEAARTKNFGFIVRTAAEKCSEKEILQDIENLKEKWKQMLHNAKRLNQTGKVHSETNKTIGLLRDKLSEDFERIVVNNSSLSKEIKEYLKKIAPNKTNIVELYRGKEPIFDKYTVSHQIKALFGRHVNMKSGASLVIEHTEALHVIDVNSGTRTSAATQQSTSVTTNLEAVQEIARQLRLRDLGGIIIIDFIDMKAADHREMVGRRMKEAMEPDKAKHTILPITKFGLMQITRQRVKPEVKISTTETCPLCQGSGSVRSTLLILDDIERDIDYLFTKLNYKKLLIEMHPFVYAYLTQGLWNQQRQWSWKYKKQLTLRQNAMLGIADYKFVDEAGDEIFM